MPLFLRRSETVEQMIDRVVGERKTDLFEQELQKFDPSRLTRKEKETWHLYWGITAFRRGDRAEAFRRFTEAYEACPESQEIRFSLGQEYEARGDIDKMLELFGSCEFPHISSRHVLTASRYAYLWSRFEKAADFLQPIFKAYFALGIADDHFLYVRGLPFFGETWSYLLCYSILTRNLRSIRDFTGEAKARLSDYDFDKLILFLDCWESEDFGAKITELEAIIAKENQQFPLGYQRVQLASLKSLRELNPALLTHVVVDERDFPWLEDVLLIHRARIANISNDNLKESQLVDKFFERQPMLFEPDHASTFAFVHYQETLKDRYQASRLKA